MYQPFHFYLVFNPMLNSESVYATQAHEFYQSLKQIKSESECLFWGKISVTENEEDLEHFKLIVEQNKSHGFDTHLYLTDYHHFWVAKVEGVQKEIFNQSLTLPFYDNKKVSAWFKISDMDLLSAEFQESNHFIGQLYMDSSFSPRKIQSLNPYIGGLNFPLIVQDRSSEEFFKQDRLRLEQQNLLIENPRYLQETQDKVTTFVLPPDVYKQLKYDSKQLILNSEANLNLTTGNRVVREQIFFNYSLVLENVLDQVVGDLLRHNFASTLKISADGNRFVQECENSLFLKDWKKPIPLNAYIHLIDNIDEFTTISFLQIEKDFPKLISYFVDQIKPILFEHEALAKFNSMKAGVATTIAAKEVFKLRNLVLGVGCQGVINFLFNEHSAWQVKSRETAA